MIKLIIKKQYLTIHKKQDTFLHMEVPKNRFFIRPCKFPSVSDELLFVTLHETWDESFENILY